MKKLPWVSLGLLLLGLLAYAQEEKSDLTWMLAYRDKGENALASDPRFEPFLASDLPSIPLPAWGDEPVNKAAVYFLDGVPGDIEVRGQRYLTASGCPAHACVSHAMIWVDTASKTVFFIASGDEQYNFAKATTHQYPTASEKLYLATKSTIAPDALPDELCGSVVRWLHLGGVLQVTQVTLLTPAGPQPVTTDKLGWTRPPFYNGKPLR